MQNLRELTILVPSFNRPNFLKRMMAYWSGRGPKIVVADGSARPVDSGLLSYFDDNIEYNHFRNLSIQKRISYLVSHANSKYAMLQADDEFFIPSSLNEQIEYLECQGELISCVNKCVSFCFTGKDLLSKIIYPEFEDYELSSPLPKERINFHMKHYTPSLVYAVSRSEYLKTALDLARQANQFSFWASVEIIVEMALAYLGKSKVINTLGWLRSKENERIQGKGAHERHSSRFTTWWESEKMENERALFTQLFAEKMTQADGRAVSEIKHEAHEGLKSYYGFSKNYHAGRHWFNRPEPMEEPMMDLAKKLMSSGVEVNLGELEEVKQIIMDFHSKPVAKAG